MRKAMLLTAVAMAMATGPASADKLSYAAGGGVEGLLQEVTFLVNGLPSIYPRSEIAAVTVGEGGKDALKCQDGRTVEGKLASVRFRTTRALMTMTRKEVAGIEVDADYELPEAAKKPGVSDSPSTEPKPTVTASPAQQQAYATNKKLYKAYAAKADEQRKKDIEAFSRQYKNKWENVNREAESLAKQVDSKLHRRQTASRQYRGSESRYRNDYERLLRTDDLLRTQRELNKAKKERDKLKKQLKNGRKEIDERAETREKRIKAIANEIARDIKAGNDLNEDQMRRRYDAAIQAKGDGKKSREKKRDG